MDGADGEPMTKNRRHRTLRQQMLNKQAQQRYRCGLPSTWVVCQQTLQCTLQTKDSKLPLTLICARGRLHNTLNDLRCLST